MRILHIIDHLGFGGAQIVTKSILEGSNSENVFLYALRESENQIIIQHKNVYTARSSSKCYIKSFFKLARFIRDNNITILHCHLAKSNALGFLLKKIFFKHIKLLFHEHGKIVRSDKTNRSSFVYKSLVRMAKKEVNLFIAISNMIKKELIEKACVEPDKIVVLYNFVDPRRFHIREELDRRQFGFEKEDYLVGFAGRIIKRKGWEEFIRSAYLLKSRGCQIGVVIAGEGPEKTKMLTLLKELNITNCVKYLGFLPDMNPFYNLIDCLVIPSHWEPMGLVAIEAQACGVPVIASNIEGLNEMITDGENGLLFERANERDLAEKIELVQKDRTLRDELISNGLRTVKKYSLDEYIRSLETIYQKV